MTVINKQKFLAELGKLLTFMYEEDRMIALGLYESMFDSCENEQLLLQHLGTPTRQAVMVARAYNSHERKLQISSDSRSDEETQDPQFISVIQNVERAFVTRYGIVQQEEVSEDQISLFETFDLSSHPEEEPAAEQPDLFELTDETFGLQPEAEEGDVEVDEAEETEDESEAETVENDASDPEAEETGEEDLQQPDGESSETLSELTEKDELPPQQEAAEEDFVEYELETVQPEEPKKEEFLEEEPDEEEETAPVSTVRKAKPLALLLYILVSIPVILAGIAILLVPTVLFLLLATAAVILGVLVVTFPFGGLTVFADIMLVLGVGIIVLALGFLFLWTFVWLIGGAIVGHIQGVIRLGGKLCYKEVPVV